MIALYNIIVVNHKQQIYFTNNIYQKNQPNKMIKTNTKSYDKHPLSQSWQTSQKMSSNRLSFFGKGITCIDKLQSIPEKLLHSIKQLDLSHNVITRIENIRQFPNLEVINLAHNHIIDGKSLVKLDRLKKLKVVMVKGNPFLKSGQGKLIAWKFLLSYQTDIQILTNLLQQLLMQSINKFSLVQIKKQYYKHIELQIELITEFNIILPEQCTGQIYTRIMQQVVQGCLENVLDSCRREVIRCVTRDRDGGFNGLETREVLQDWFKGCLEVFEEGLDRELDQWNKLIQDKQEILNHVKKMRKQKHAKSTQSLGLRKITKPLLLKPTNNQNIPSIPKPRQNSPRKELFNKTGFLSASEQQQPSEFMPPLSKKNLQQKFQSYYNIMLIKYNPVYQLLYSPLHSLKNKQKDLLIQTLSSHLKQKSFAVYKCDKIKEQYSQLNRRYIQKEKLLKSNQEKFMGFKIGMNERVALAEQSNQKKDKIIEDLTYKISLLNSQKSEMTKRLQYLQEELSESKLKGIKQNSIIQKSITEEYIAEQIENIRSQRIKKQHMKLLQNKADKLAKLKKTQQLNKNHQYKELTQFCFRFIRSEAENKRLSKFISSLNNKNKMKYFINNFNENARHLLCIAKLNKKIKQNKGQQIVNLLVNRLQQKKKVQTIVNKFKIWQKKLQTQMYFRQWRLSAEDRKNEQNAEKANTYYKYSLQRKMFKNWLVYMKLPIFQEAELSVDLKTAKMNKFLYLLKQNSQTSGLLQSKFLNLVVFLNRNRRIFNFFRFKKFAVLNSELRGLKEKRITLTLKSNYFYEFFKVTHNMKKYRAQNQQKQQQLLSLRKKILFNKFNSESYTKELQIKRLKKIAEIYRKMNIAESLRQSLKQFMIQDKRNKNDIKTFFSLLQSSCHRKLKISNKSIQLKLLLNTNLDRISENFRTKKQFIQKLQQPKKQKNRLKQFLNKKYFNMMLKHFNMWRVDAFRSQIQYLKLRIHEFGPQIEQISKRQKSVFEQKQVLMNIIDNKQKTIKGYVKQLQQAQYTIKTKQEKYRKLKDFLHDTGDDVTVIGSKVQPSFLMDSNNRIPERDYDTFLDEERKDFVNSFRRF